MTAILGRMAAYSGKLVTWDEAVKSDLSYAPDRIAWDSAAAIETRCRRHLSQRHAGDHKAS